MSYRMGLDIGGTNIRIAISEARGAARQYRKLPRERVLTGEDSMQRLAGFLKEYMQEYKDGQLPEAVVIGFPATVDAARRVILQAPNIPGLDGLPVVEELEALLGIPVYIEKDVNLLFYSDMEDLGLPPEGIGIGIYVGTGIGNAIFYNGMPLPGKHGVSGELGHIPRADSKRRCGCGNLGCSECYGSGRRLAEIQKEQFPDTPIQELFTRHAAEPVLKEFIEEIACTAAAEINILDPEYIVLGGGVLNMQDFPLEELKKAIYQHARKPYPAEGLCFYHSKDAEENGVRGALALGWRKAEE